MTTLDDKLVLDFISESVKETYNDDSIELDEKYNVLFENFSELMEKSHELIQNNELFQEGNVLGNIKLIGLILIQKLILFIKNLFLKHKGTTSGFEYGDRIYFQRKDNFKKVSMEQMKNWIIEISKEINVHVIIDESLRFAMEAGAGVVPDSRRARNKDMGTNKKNLLNPSQAKTFLASNSKPIDAKTNDYKPDYETVKYIKVSPSFFRNRCDTKEGTKGILMHEYGHILTLNKFSIEEYAFKVTMLRQFLHERSYWKQGDIEEIINLAYRCIPAEKAADEYAGYDTIGMYRLAYPKVVSIPKNWQSHPIVKFVEKDIDINIIKGIAVGMFTGKMNLESSTLESVKYLESLYKDLLPTTYKEQMKKEFDAVLNEKDPSRKNVNESVEINSNDSEPKKVLRILTQNIIDGIKNNKEVTPANIKTYENLINKELLKNWTSGFNKIKLNLDKNEKHLFEFIPPKLDLGFVSRFVYGKETINGLLHKNPEIQINISSKLFKDITNPDNIYNFFKSAIQYYDKGIESIGNKIMVEVTRLHIDIKHLISTTKLSGVIIYPLSTLFIFDKLDVNNKNPFDINEEDVKTINKFIKNIIINYSSPEKEKEQIISDVKEMIKTLHESCENNDNIRYLSYLPEAVENYLNKKYDGILQEGRKLFYEAQIDKEIPTSKELQYVREAFGVKKLKKIPIDLIAYISIEADAIRDANDKMMIASYCLGKLEIVEWYIELLEVGSKKYIVPHTKPYLENIRTQLLACYKKIMDTKITNPNDRPLLDIKYPKGYEG